MRLFVEECNERRKEFSHICLFFSSSSRMLDKDPFEMEDEEYEAEMEEESTRSSESDGMFAILNFICISFFSK